MNSLFDSGQYYVCGAVQNSRKIKVACEQALGKEEGRGGKKESKLSGKRRGREGRSSESLLAGYFSGGIEPNHKCSLVRCPQYSTQFPAVLAVRIWPTSPKTGHSPASEKKKQWKEIGRISILQLGL